MLKIPHGLSAREALTRTVNEAFFEDNCLGLAAQLAYYFFLALFPALLFMLALASYFPYQAVQGMVDGIAGFAPPDVVGIIRDYLGQLARGEDTGLLTVGILGAVWSSSTAMGAIIDAMNRAYDVTETRPWWKVRLRAIALTVLLAIFIVISFTLILAGPTAAEWVAAYTGYGNVLEWTWKIVQWPIALGLVIAAIAFVYYFAPDARQEWRRVALGAVVASVLWLAASLGFKLYVSNFTDYTATYGAVGGVIVMLLWFYISGLAILLGAELNSVLEHADPTGKDPGEREAGEGPDAESLAALSHGNQPVVVVQRASVLRDVAMGMVMALAFIWHRGRRRTQS